MLEYIAVFAAGVVSSESVRRLWNTYAVPKIAALKLKVAAVLGRG